MSLTTTEEAQTRALIAQNAAILSLAASEPSIISKLAATKVSLADLTPAVSLDDADLFLVRQGLGEKSVSTAIIKADVLTGLDASDVSYLPAGVGAVATDVQSKLRESVSVKDFGAVGDGVTDDTVAIQAALAAGKSVFFPDGTYLISSKITLSSSGQELIGAGRLRSKILLSGDIDGIELRRQNRLAHLRVIGNDSMTSRKACVLLGGPANDSPRTRIHDCVIGGTLTEMGDETNLRITGDAIKGSNTFLNTISDCYIANSEVGYYNKNGTANNAMLFSGTEFHKCVVGVIISPLNSVKFDTCTFENNDECGAIVGSSRSASFKSCYFEANHTMSNAAYCTDSGGVTRKADLLVIADATITGSTDPGASISIEDTYISGFGQSAYGIYIDKQRFIKINGAFFTGDWPAGQGLYVGSSTDNTGHVGNFYSSITSLLTNNAVFVSVGPYEFSGQSAYKGGLKLGDSGLVQSLSGTTASLAGTSPGPAGSENLFTPIAGRSYLLFIKNSSSTSSSRWIGWVQSHTSSALTITVEDSAGITVSNSSGSVSITNGSGSATVYNWAAIRIL